MLFIEAIKDTKAKKDALDSTVTKGAILNVPKGKKYGVESYKPAKNGHYRVVLASGAGTWFFYAPDVKFSDNQKVNPLLPSFKGGNRELTIKATIEYGRSQGLTNPQLAYVLATVEHETNDTFQPVKEAYWVRNAESWRRNNLRYYPYYGRGYVQLTWEYNYKRFSSLLGLPLVSNPDLVMRADISLFVLIYGMINGTFTGAKLSKFVNRNKVDFVNARRVINGMDKANHIAGLANKWLALINRG